MAKTFDSSKPRAQAPVAAPDRVVPKPSETPRGLRLVDTLSMTYEPPFEVVLHNLNMPHRPEVF